ncbi:hypothetical protein GN958_ATG17762 [Phytophthora infestans]|uniref:MARVEL domain-containing protein n=1 Tax=Phytophthora infestans TaxID=4787 RepID=A0A8S9TW63_PHYIN|nr:hypothetical protein GN958_ATG17762 [Phytophthora infestans]
MLARTRRTLRAAQFLCGLLGLSFVAAGGVSFHSSNFVLLINYTGVLYTLWFVMAVEILNYSTRTSTRVDQGIDGVLALTLLIGDCSFLGMFAFLATLALSILAASKETPGPTEVPGQYHMEATPTDALSTSGPQFAWR